MATITPKNSKNNFPKANREINAASVRLVDQNGNMIGVVSINEALNLAVKAGLDLVEIVPNSVPPVCKILDFGKFKYDSKKKVQDSRKKQKVTALKEMKFKLNIGQSDFDVKLRKIKEFLEDGDKVKISLWFKGREIVHSTIGMQLFDRIIAGTSDIAKIESPPKMEGKQIIMVLSALQVK